MMGQAALLAVLVLAVSVWVGGYVAIVVVARTATQTLTPEFRVQFFRALGRRYLWVGLPALLIALTLGAFLLRDHAWDALLLGTLVAAVVLVGLLVVAVAQARRMTRLRRQAGKDPTNHDLGEEVARGGRRAAALRAMLGVLSVSLVVLGAFLGYY